jgi:hypothetical protein
MRSFQFTGSPKTRGLGPLLTKRRHDIRRKPPQLFGLILTGKANNKTLAASRHQPLQRLDAVIRCPIGVLTPAGFIE